MPTEVHVFTSLAARMPVMVGTGTGPALRVWPVLGARIGTPQTVQR